MSERVRKPRELSTGSWRVFCAIELPAVVRARINQHIALLREAVPGALPSWSRAENIHLTVKFFGDVSADQIEQISDAAARTVRDFSPFKIAVADTGAFPKPGQPRVLWIGIDDRSGRLTEFQKLFEHKCELAGFSVDDREFRPHLTIARLRRADGARELAQANQRLGFVAEELTVNELVVFRSELSSKGSQYTALSRHRFSVLKS